MGDVINLNRFRKRKQREALRRRADENARRYGRRASDRQLEQSERRKLDDTLEGARMKPPEGED